MPTIENEFKKLEVLIPSWDVPSHLKAMVTLRTGGYSEGVYSEFNLATHVNDQLQQVKKNRTLLTKQFNLPNEPSWLKQTHSSDVQELTKEVPDKVFAADASWTKITDAICVVLTADCLPIFLYHPKQQSIAAIHAGWRGLANGIIENTVSQMTQSSEHLKVWLGPAIGTLQFEVGAEVREIFCTIDSGAEQCFSLSRTVSAEKYYHADIYQLAILRLNKLGITNISGGDFCTVTEEQRFYSYRRDGETGRMASLIWLEAN